MRIRFRFSLRTLLIVVLLACIGARYVGLWMVEARAQRAAVQEIEASKGFVVYDFQVTADDRLDVFAEPSAPVWLQRWLGRDAVADVVKVSLSSYGVISRRQGFSGVYETEEAHAAMIAGRLRSLDSLVSLRLVGPGFSDIWLEQIEGLTTLREIHLTGTSVTPAGVSHLRHALPECQVSYDDWRRSAD